MVSYKIKNVLSFILLTAATLTVCITTFTLLADNGSPATALALNFMVNYPLCLALGTVDYMIISRMHRRWHMSSGLQVITDWLFTSVTGAAVSLSIRYAARLDNDYSAGLLTFLVWNSMVVLIIEMFLYHKGIMEKETELARIEQEKAEYQFRALKNQINPHFLFNSLNVLASLAYQDAEKTNIFAKKLSCVYRYLLTTYDKRLVTLSEELDFLDAYLYLEKLRFGKAVNITININREARQKQIVPASLQLLVENALKHNAASDRQPLHIKITGYDNSITVENNLQLRSEVATSKVGLRNLQRQYCIYGGAVRVTKTDRTFSVTIPLLNQSA